MKCPHCGQEHPDDFLLCPYTGKSLKQQTKVCGNPDCQYPNVPIEAKYCPRCGWEFSQRNNSEREESHVIPHNNHCFDNIGQFNEGIAVIVNNGKYGLISKSGEIILDCIYKKTLPLSEGLSAVENEHEEWFFVNCQGDIVLLLDKSYYVTAETGFRCGLCAVMKWDNLTEQYLYGFIDKNGYEVIKCQYSWVNDFNQKTELAVVELEEHGQFIINKLGEKQTDFFSSVEIVDDFLIMHDYPNTNIIENRITGERIYLPKVSSSNLMLGIGEGLCSYVVNNKLVCFDIGCPNMRYSFKEPIDSFYSHFSNGLLAVRACGNGAGFVDSKCNIIIPLIYRNVKDFTCGLAAVQSQDTLKWGYINIKGELVIDFKYDEATQFYDDVASVKYEGHQIVIDISDTVIFS